MCNETFIGLLVDRVSKSDSHTCLPPTKNTQSQSCQNLTLLMVWILLDTELIPKVLNRKVSYNWRRELGSQVQAKKNRSESESRGECEDSSVCFSLCPLEHPLQRQGLLQEKANLNEDSTKQEGGS